MDDVESKGSALLLESLVAVFSLSCCQMLARPINHHEAATLVSALKIMVFPCDSILMTGEPAIRRNVSKKVACSMQAHKLDIYKFAACSLPFATLLATPLSLLLMVVGLQAGIEALVSSTLSEKDRESGLSESGQVPSRRTMAVFLAIVSCLPLGVQKLYTACIANYSCW